VRGLGGVQKAITNREPDRLQRQCGRSAPAHRPQGVGGAEGVGGRREGGREGG
jgi:hypothetical protein